MFYFENIKIKICNIYYKIKNYIIVLFHNCSSQPDYQNLHDNPSDNYIR